MKILFLTRVLPIHGSGGMQQHAENVINQLLVNNDVTVLTTKVKGKENEFKVKNLRIYYLDKTVSGKYYGGWWKQSGKKLQDVLEKEKYEVILSESISACSYYKYKLNLIYKTPVLMFAHGAFSKEIKTTLKKKVNLKYLLSFLYKYYLYYFFDRIFYDKVSAIISASEEISKILAEIYPNSKIVVVRNGIDTTRFDKKLKDEKIMNMYNISIQDKVLLCVGRIEKEKGLDDVLSVLPDLIAKNPKIKFLLVGNGEYTNEIFIRINKMHIENNVILAGYVDQEKLAKLYNIADIFIFPSHCDEGLPLVVLEALSSGLPSICARGAGTEEIIDDGEDGYLYEKGNIEELSNKLNIMLCNSELYGKIAKSARKKAEAKFSQTVMVSKIEKIIKLTLCKN